MTHAKESFLFPPHNPPPQLSKHQRRGIRIGVGVHARLCCFTVCELVFSFIKLSSLKAVDCNDFLLTDVFTVIT